MSNITEKRVSLQKKLEYLAREQVDFKIGFSTRHNKYTLFHEEGKSASLNNSKSLPRLIGELYDYIKQL